MKTFSLSRAAGGAALALALGLGLHSGAWAAQSITVSTAVGDVCGNGDAANNGAWPCANSPDGNTVTITSTGSTGAVWGGNSMIATGDATASGNTVKVVGGVVTGPVSGAYAQTSSGNATASGNTVLIDGGTISGGPIVGGHAYSGSTDATATGNTVTIQGSPTFTGVGSLIGGDADVNSNNTLNLHAAGLSVLTVNGFQNLNFFLPASLTTGSPMLVSAAADLGANAVVRVSLEGATLHTGDSFVLLNNVTAGSLAAASASGTVGGYQYTLEIDASNNLLLTIGALAPAAGNAAAVPTLGEYGLALLALLLGGLGFAAMRRKG